MSILGGLDTYGPAGVESYGVGVPDESRIVNGTLLFVALTWLAALVALVVAVVAR